MDAGGRFRDFGAATDRCPEDTFSLCTVLHVDAPARAGRLLQTRHPFARVRAHADHVGLFGEEIRPSRERRGAFPQAFAHLSPIMTAGALDEALDAEKGR
ncbi:hypothetical protein [Streptomyces sp. NPDC005486]|uniref:hypothetical protein n=1 Tax=Streptomyces sp. NPDC005486 TaxID=3155345 RepID=UPI00339DE5F3